MKYHLSFIITVHCFIAATCSAMEKQIGTPAKILMELNVIQHPDQVICFPNDNDIAAIAGRDGCSLCNVSTNTEIKKLNCNDEIHTSRYIGAHPREQLLALLDKDTLTIYDIPTRDKIWEKTTIGSSCSPCFNPRDTTVIIGKPERKIESFNYKNNTDKLYPMKGFVTAIKMAFHPTKEEFILTTNNRDAITIRKFDENSLSIIKNFPMKDLTDIRYSPDGSLIAINTTYPFNGCSILNPDSESRYGLLNNNKKPLYAMEFYPSSFILATLSSDFKHIFYWDAQKLLFVTTTVLTLSDDEIFRYTPPTYGKRLAFSCDGTKLIVALKNKCLVLEVPFEVLSDEAYQLNTQDKCLFTLWTLQHLYDNETMPQDIRHVVTQYLLGASKYSLINH